jgi:hypothetical protein
MQPQLPPLPKGKGAIYIAGPMRNRPLFNFPAFDAAEFILAAQGWNPINPASMDRAVGFNPERDVPDKAFLDAALKRDVQAIIEKADALVLLPGWEQSTGAKAEMALAKWKHIPIYAFPSMKPIDEEEDVLEEALRITSGARQEEYGPPDKDFARTAAIWSALKGVDFTAAEVALFMIAVKLSREVHQPKRDSAVDIAGYARCLHLCRKAEAQRGI